jgi:hypothetical protein
MILYFNFNYKNSNSENFKYLENNFKRLNYFKCYFIFRVVVIFKYIFKEN